MNVDYATLLWSDFMNCVFQKKDVIQYPRFTKLIIANLMKKYPFVSPRIEKDYHSIKDDIPLVSVYTIRNVRVWGMMIPDAFLIDKIHATDDYKEEEEEKTARDTSSLLKSLKVTMKQKQVVEGERDEESYADNIVASMLHDDDDFDTKIEPESHKEHPELVDDDDDNEEEKRDKKKYDEMGSLEIRTDKMQTSILTPPRSPRIILSLDKNIN
uniref:Uncharacterized protein n=1 Tax=Tanacetum cinerariifolium TaxID=118510 RepID=A0A6L2MI91_TANCI|nr:hypothetical protein [Tanacetum cinerariifolium]